MQFFQRLEQINLPSILAVFSKHSAWSGDQFLSSASPIIIFLVFSHALINTATHSEGRCASTMILTKVHGSFKLCYSTSSPIAFYSNTEINKRENEVVLICFLPV